MKKYDLSHIMKKAWELFRKVEITFSEALHRAWLSAKAAAVNQKRIEDAKTAAGVEEETNTWSGWKKLGYEVIHGSKALFVTELIWGSRGDGAVYKAHFFGARRYMKLRQIKEVMQVAIRTPLKAIRAKCLECSSGQIKEVRLCVIKKCPLYEYRMGHRPLDGENPIECK